MPNKRDLRLERYSIGKYAYRELHNFCLQYPEKKRRLRELESPYKSPQITGMPSGSGPGDPTGRNADRASVLSGDIELIERTAAAVSCGRRKFYDMRRVFFYLLAQSKGYV